MTTREELADHLLLSYVLTYNGQVLREFVQNPAAVLDRLGLPADAMRCPPAAHRARGRAEGVVREVEALGGIEALQALPIVAEIVTRSFTSPVELVKIPFGVQFGESQATDGEQPPAMAHTGTATVQCTWGLACGADVDG